MKCPLLTATSERLTGMSEYPPLDCLKEECAWWGKEYHECAINLLSIFMPDIRDSLSDISFRMPKDLAPRG